MRRSLFLPIILTIFTGCSLLKQTPKEPDIHIQDNQLIEAVQSSVTDLMKEQWLSDYLTSTNERPILMTSTISSHSTVFFNVEITYETIDLTLLQSGQVRVVKTNNSQRLMTPAELAKGKSVDFVLSVNIEKDNTTSPSTIIFALSLWGENITTPIVEIRNEIKLNILE